MHEKTFTFIALMLAFSYSTPSFAQAEPMWWTPGQARKVYEEKVARSNKRNKKSMMDQNGNCQNGYDDTGGNIFGNKSICEWTVKGTQIGGVLGVDAIRKAAGREAAQQNKKTGKKKYSKRR